MIKLYICCLVLIIGSVEVGLDIGMKFHQEVMEIVSYDINTLYTKLVHLDKQVQIHCLYPHPQSDIIQLNTPDYNPNIDGDLDPATDVQPPNAQSNKEDTSTDTPKTEDHTTIPPITNRPEH